MKNHRTMGPVADNTEATINHLNANQDRVHMLSSRAT